MKCEICNNPNAYRFFRAGNFRCCDKCGFVQISGMPDIYWDGKEEHGLPDDPKTGRPMVFRSKLEKQNFLRENCLVEAGDKTHGAFTSILDRRVHRGDSSVAMQALAAVKEMGKDYRRQEINRILKDTGRL
mgnify:CR=1 FL=1